MTLDIQRNRFLKFALLAGLGLFILLAGGLRLAEAAQLAISSVDKLNLRSSPNTSSAIVGQINKGDRLTVTGKSGDWYKIQFGDKTAWVAGWLVSVQDTAVSRGTTSNQGKIAEVTGTTLNIRSGPGTNFNIAGSAKKGDKLTILAQNGDWYQIQFGNIKGWVANWLVSVQNTASTQTTPSNTATTGSKVAEVTADTVNIRSGAGTNFAWQGVRKRGISLLYCPRVGIG
ncbi:hypothetical protein N752_02860 [Desulforamulus aquiferis]|nr:SH3 domain-containing protein [Desulforamulus aquiferis]RYD06627.1 hypothetical protein N752_02860 [Desulforamulus aquiferis]